MKVITSPTQRALLTKLVAVVCVILACIVVTHGVQAAFLDFQVKNMTAEIKNLKMKTVCVGRFLIDVPNDAEVTYRGAMIAGWSIATYHDETDEQFVERIKKKEVELGATENEHGMPSLERTQQIDQNGVQGKIHVFGREWIRGLPNEKVAEDVRIDATIREKKKSFNLTIENGDDSDLTELVQLVSQFRARAENEIPTEAGYCFDGGFITEPITIKQSERTTMFVGLKGHPDVSIMLDMTAGIVTPKTLFERDDRNSVRLEYSSRFHTFRRGSRPFLGNAGEEILERVHEEDGSYGHDFMWEPIHNNPGDLLTPLMSFELSTGHGSHGKTVNSSLTDAEAIALWDKMLSSLRVRPVHITKPVAAVPPQVPLGALAYASESCPETGWWECNDGDKDTPILAGRQQYYRKGERMGQAIQLMPTTPAQRLLGQRPTFTSKIPSMWKLVSRRQYPRIASTVALAGALTAPVDDVNNDNAPDAEQDEAMTPPGSLADSGMVCPASGWWRCVEVNALDGTRWFGRGQNLPMATVRQPLSTLEKLKGTSDVTLRKTPWQLIRPDSGAPNLPTDSATPDDDASKPA